MSDSLQPCGLQHVGPPCPSPTPGIYPNSCPLSRWCHPTISSSVLPFSSHLQSWSASGSFPMSQLFISGGQRIGVSASTSVPPMNTQNWFPLGWTGWISLQSKGLSKVFSNATVQKHQFCGAQLFFIVQLSYPYMTTGKTIALTKWTFVGKVMSLLFNMLSRLVITFLPRSKRLLISCAHSHTGPSLEASSGMGILIFLCTLFLDCWTSLGDFSGKQILSWDSCVQNIYLEACLWKGAREAELERGRSLSATESQQSQSWSVGAVGSWMAPQSCPKMGGGARPSYRHPSGTRRWLVLEGSGPAVRQFSSAEAIPEESDGKGLLAHCQQPGEKFLLLEGGIRQHRTVSTTLAVPSISEWHRGQGFNFQSQ